MTIATALAQGAKLFEDALISAPRLTAEVLLAQVAQHELVGGAGRELRPLEVYGSHEESFLLEAPDEMGADEPAAAENESCTHTRHVSHGRIRTEYADRACARPQAD